LCNFLGYESTLSNPREEYDTLGVKAELSKCLHLFTSSTQKQLIVFSEYNHRKIDANKTKLKALIAITGS
jgi:hypothetical protein